MKEKKYRLTNERELTGECLDLCDRFKGFKQFRGSYIGSIACSRNCKNRLSNEYCLAFDAKLVEVLCDKNGAPL